MSYKSNRDSVIYYNNPKELEVVSVVVIIPIVGVIKPIFKDNLTITAKTMIDYTIWGRIPETYDYIVKDCPAMLFSITYLIAAVYAGVISSKLAIEEIDSWNK